MTFCVLSTNLRARQHMIGSYFVYLCFFCAFTNEFYAVEELFTRKCSHKASPGTCISIHRLFPAACWVNTRNQVPFCQRWFPLWVDIISSLVQCVHRTRWKRDFSMSFFLWQFQVLLVLRMLSSTVTRTRPTSHCWLWSVLRNLFLNHAHYWKLHNELIFKVSNYQWLKLTWHNSISHFLRLGRLFDKLNTFINPNMITQ